MSVPNVDEAYRIVKWWQRHTNATQQRSGGSWIVCPTSFDSLGYRLLMQKPQGVTAFGVYVPLAELCGRLPTAKNPDTAGILANENGALDADSIALMIAVPVKVVGAALDLMMEPKIGWIDRVPTPVIDPQLVRVRSDDVQTESARASNGVHPRVRAHDARTAAAAAASSSKQASGGTGGAAALLRRAGVPERHIADLLDVPPPAIVAAWHEIKHDPRANRKGAVLAARLRGDERSQLKPPALMEAIADGVVLSADGAAVQGRRVTQNGEGLYLDGTLAVPAARIVAGEVELS